MNIKKWFSGFLFLIVLSGSFSVFAKQSVIINEHSSLNPVSWHLTRFTGGISLTNQTTKNQFVQVVLNTGEVAVFKMFGLECSAALGGESSQKSVVCELEPGDSLYLDLDYSRLVLEASGTYQVEMAH